MTGWIRFSKDLVKEDFRFREVVIVHELLHLQVPNHGKLFKSLMNAYVPHWQKIARGKIARVCLGRASGLGSRARDPKAEGTSSWRSGGDMKTGGGQGSRTPDPYVANVVLSQLS